MYDVATVLVHFVVVCFADGQEDYRYSIQSTRVKSAINISIY